MEKKLKIYIRLQEIINDRQIDGRPMTQKDVAELSKLRRATISEICTNTRTTINREHLEAIAQALGIKDVSELIEFRYE
ncbi:helix-turn-helix transcriptional regulator [Brevibacillus centrosporus]|uniref:helix-turn-helix domain-containing protein n=1 Tax=Brevibacillus centrosporus TaxID=54910 RepID=UPI003D21C5F0